MTLRLLIPLTFLTIALSVTRDCSQSSCFVKQLFDFNYPKEGIYNITMGIALIMQAMVQPKWIVFSRLMEISTMTSGLITFRLMAMAILSSSFSALLQATMSKHLTACRLIKGACPIITTYVCLIQ